MAVKKLPWNTAVLGRREGVGRTSRGAVERKPPLIMVLSLLVDVLTSHAVRLTVRIETLQKKVRIHRSERERTVVQRTRHELHSSPENSSGTIYT